MRLWVRRLKSLVPLVQKQLDLCNVWSLVSASVDEMQNLRFQLRPTESEHTTGQCFVHSELWFSPGLHHCFLVLARDFRAVLVYAEMSPN